MKHSRVVTSGNTVECKMMCRQVFTKYENLVFDIEFLKLRFFTIQMCFPGYSAAPLKRGIHYQSLALIKCQINHFFQPCSFPFFRSSLFLGLLCLRNIKAEL